MRRWAATNRASYAPTTISTRCKGRKWNTAVTPHISREVAKDVTEHCLLSQGQTYSWRRCGVAQQGASKQLSVSLIHCKGTLWRNSSFTATCLLQCCLFFPSKKIQKTTGGSKLIRNMNFTLCIVTKTLILKQAGIPIRLQDVLTKFIKVVTSDLPMHGQLR